MKKFLSIVLALAMVLALSVTAFAVDESELPKTESRTINATYTDPAAGTVTNVYFFTIAWGDVTAATYTGDVINYTWDPSDMAYTSAGDGSAAWTAGSVSVTITSKSDMGLTVTPTVTYATDYDGSSTMKVDDTAITEVTLESAARSDGAAFTATTAAAAASYVSSNSQAQTKTIDFTVTPTTAISAAVSEIATVSLNIAAVD